MRAKIPGALCDLRGGCTVCTADVKTSLHNSLHDKDAWVYQDETTQQQWYFILFMTSQWFRVRHISVHCEVFKLPEHLPLGTQQLACVFYKAIVFNRLQYSASA